jgi:predicted Zn finger-like uncharacterized protein
LVSIDPKLAYPKTGSQLKLIIPCKSCQSSFRIDASILKPTGSKVKCSKCKQVFRAFPPEQADRRKHPRIKTRNLISHLSFDKHGKPVSQGLSKAIDISKGGILLETPHLIEHGLISLMAVGLNNKFIEIKGELLYSERTDSGMYRSGIKFVGTDEQVTRFIIGLIREYNYRKKNLLISPDP